MYISGDNLMLMSTFNKYDSKQGLDVSCCKHTNPLFKEACLFNTTKIKPFLVDNRNGKFSTQKEYLMKFNAFTWKIEILLYLARLGFSYYPN